MKLRGVLLAVPAFFGVAALCGIVAHQNADDRRGRLEVDGRERSYELHVPKNYDGNQPIPLVLALHGRFGTGAGEEKLAHLDKLSDKHAFWVVYPNGLGRSWADGRAATPSDKSGTDDVKFISALIDNMEQEYKVDTKRIYATGMSNGGFMSGRLACDLSNRIAAVAIVAASLSENTAATCNPVQPVSVMIIQGSDDPLVPLEGGTLRRGGSGGSVLSHQAAVQKFVELNRCNSQPKKEHLADRANDGTTVDAEWYASCADGTQVHGYVVNGGGHTWPSGMPYLPAAMIGKTTHNLDASELIWHFFSGHHR